MTVEGYPIPAPTFDPSVYVANKLTRANQLRDSILSQFIETYHDFWGVASPPSGSRHTPAEMQQILAAMPFPTAVQVMRDSRNFSSFLETTYPGVLPAKYQDAAFDLRINPQAQEITVHSLKAAWQPPVVPEEPADPQVTAPLDI